MGSFFDYAWKILPDLLEGTKLTIAIAAVCISSGMICGILLGTGRVYGNRVTYRLITAYVELLRGTPVLVQLFFIYYGLGDMGILMKPIVAAGLAMAINTSAYQAEYFRGAILAVKPGQMVAARALGLSEWRVIRYVVFPQAIRLVIPSSSSEMVYMIKCTSLTFVVGVPELMSRADILGAYYFRYFETYVVAAAIYVAIVLFVAKFVNIIERKVKIPGLQMT